MFKSKIVRDIEEGINLFEFNAGENRLKFKYTSEIKEQLESVYLKHFPNLNLDSSTAQGQQITTLTQSFNACIDYLEACGTSFFLGGEGLFLDYWAWNLFRLKRKQGTPSGAIITISGIPKTKIPNTFTISDGTQNYKIENPTEISESGSVEALFCATEINSHTSAKNTITQIVTLTEGIERVDNKAPSTLAIKKESDIQLYLRALKYGSVAYNGSFRSILANVNAVKGVKRVGGYENITDAEIEIKGMAVPAHCFAVIAEGGEDYDIARAILLSKGAGAGMIGSVSVTIFSDKERYAYKFFRPEYVNFKVKVTITKLHNPPENVGDLIKMNLKAYFDNVDFGYLITQPNLVNACYNGIQNKTFIKDLQFSKADGELSYNNIQMQFLESPIIDFENVEIILQEN